MPRPRKKESGFALLLVLLMGAIMAISLYMEIPRVGFETQRQKEQVLIQRGEQYKRAIQLFVRANNRWPAKIEDLESTNGRRFLRRRYIDPMTGKDEWRAIHIQNGILTDSKVQKQTTEKKEGSTSAYLGEAIAGLGQQPVNNGQANAVNPGLRRRGSDTVGPGGPGAGGMAGVAGVPNAPPGVPGMPGMPGMPGGPPAGATGQAGLAGVSGAPGFPTQNGGVGGIGVPGQPGATGNRPGMPGSTPPSGAATSSGSSYLGAGSSYLGGGTSTGSQPSNPTNVQMPGQMPGQFPGQPSQLPGGAVFPPGSPVNSQVGGVSPSYNTAPGSNGNPPGFGQPGMTVNPQAQNAAAQMIGQILTQPRPGGMPQANSNGVSGMGGGIAGFASTADQDSIMIYNDQQNYGEWEFIFDPAKQKLAQNPAGSSVGTPASQLGSPAGTPANQVGTPAGGVPFGTPMQPPRQ
jgi:type II secretory pathway pseudopilin PulG